MNGGFGELRNGFSSTDVTVNVAPVRPCAEPLGVALVEDPGRGGVAGRADRVVEVLPARHLLTADPDERGAEGRGGGELGGEVPVAGGHEGHPLPFPLDDQPDRRGSAPVRPTARR